MKKILIALTLFAFTVMVSQTSFGLDKSPPGIEQTKFTKIEKESFTGVTIVAEYPAQLTVENPPGELILSYAEPTTVQNVNPTLVVEDATLFYNYNLKIQKTRPIKSVDYSLIGYNKRC